MKKNVLLNYSFTDKCIDSIDGEIFLQSLSRLKGFEKVVFVNSVSERGIKTLSKYFDKIIPTEESMQTGHYAYYKWLVERQDEYDLVFQTDLRDVVLQGNPFEFMQKHPDKHMFYTCEGMKVKDNTCNLYWESQYRTLLRHYNEDYKESFVVNGGIIGGRIDYFLNHLLMVFTNINRNINPPVMDQQFITYMYQHMNKNPKIMFCHPNTDNFCVTGEAVKWGNITINHDGNNAISPANQPYYIYHQWDRTKHADLIRDKFKRTLSFVL
jgi:thiamine pyrophosphokinase